MTGGISYPRWVDDPLDYAAALEKTGYWGRRGAGCIVIARSTGRLLLALRSVDVVEPLTWGTWGGAVPVGASPEETVRQELWEETAYDGPIDLIPLHVFKDDEHGFVYENFVAVVEDEFEPVLNWESAGFRWVREGHWPAPLHFGMKDLLRAVPRPSSVVPGGLKPGYPPVLRLLKSLVRGRL